MTLGVDAPHVPVFGGVVADFRMTILQNDYVSARTV